MTRGHGRTRSTCQKCVVQPRLAELPNRHWVYRIQLCDACTERHRSDTTPKHYLRTAHGRTSPAPTLEQLERRRFRGRRVQVAEANRGL